MKSYITRNIVFICYQIFFSVLMLIFFCLIDIPFGSALVFVLFLFLAQLIAGGVFFWFSRFLKGVVGKDVL
jgi:uncharacterized membrane protein YGL010W